MDNLTRLFINNNQIVEITPLAGLMNLCSMAIDNSAVVDIAPIARLENLNMLCIYVEKEEASHVANLREYFPNCKLYVCNI